MRWLVASCFGGWAAALVPACAGEPFTLGSALDAAAVSDAESEASSDVGSRDATEDVANARFDASVADAFGSRDATNRDAPLLLDVLGQSDTADEPLAHCGGRFACAPAVPVGWMGPFALYAGSPPLPACGPNFYGPALDGYAGLTAPAAVCTCACGPPQGVQCSSPAVSFYGSSATCATLGALPCGSASLIPGACTPVDVTRSCGALLGNTMTLPTSTVSPGNCMPLGTVAVARFTWATNARACGSSIALTQADCAAGTVCAPVSTTPFQRAVCIAQSGDVACPLSGYTTRSVYYARVDDSRGCPGCSCGPVTGASCTNSIDQFTSSDGGCTTRQTTYLAGRCQPVQQPADLQLTVTASGGACAPDAGAPVGSATPAGVMTYCCTP